jgi:hypothetical protein
MSIIKVLQERVNRVEADSVIFGAFGVLAAGMGLRLGFVGDHGFRNPEKPLFKRQKNFSCVLFLFVLNLFRP